MQTCDIVIVGGGVMGVSIAHALARRRVGSVVLLEKSFLGAGSSGKSGAIIRQHYSNRLTASMAQKSLRVFEHFEDVIGGPPVPTNATPIRSLAPNTRAALAAVNESAVAPTAVVFKKSRRLQSLCGIETFLSLAGMMDHSRAPRQPLALVSVITQPSCCLSSHANRPA